MQRFVLSFVGLLCLAAGPSLADGSYVRNVRPFLKKYCVECHNSKDEAAGGYKVETFADLLRAGKKGALVVPGKPENSRMIQAMEHQEKVKAMPPKKSAQPTVAEFAKVRAWIAAGAKNDTPGAESAKKRDGVDP